MCPVARQCFLQGRGGERFKAIRHCDAHESGIDQPSTRQLDKPSNHQTFSSLLTLVSPHHNAFISTASSSKEGQCALVNPSDVRHSHHPELVLCAMYACCKARHGFYIPLRTDVSLTFFKRTIADTFCFASLSAQATV